jgi:hypothetical protein
VPSGAYREGRPPMIGVAMQAEQALEIEFWFWFEFGSNYS